MQEIVIRELAYYVELASKNHRGLVPMQFHENAMPYVIGDIAGFKPADARAMHGQGQAVPYFKPGADRPAEPVRPVDPVPAGAMETARLDALDVTADAFKESKLTRIALAKKILNVPQNTGGIGTDRADEIIRQELERRGTPYQPQDETGGALTSANGTGPLPAAGAEANPPAPPQTPGIVPAIPAGQPAATE